MEGVSYIDEETRGLFCLLQIREAVEDTPGTLMQNELVDRIRALSKEKTCNWSQEEPDQDGPWGTACGFHYHFDDPDDGPDFVFRYCPFCGGKILI